MGAGHWPLYDKRPSQMVWNIRSFNRGLFVGARAWLLTDHSQFTHQPSTLETTDDNAFLTEQAFDDPAARRATTLRTQKTGLSLQG
ncbi:hypothetical protein BGP77_17495 [Saccharospirillum sp. MSK14-1]|nr:hypothetical protein BGP77_17495 [Saccharospirillum sp. MSK14-1]